MKDIVFKIQREPCIPNPCYKDAKAAKERISSLGGRFYRFSINGCISIARLERHLIESYGLSRSAVHDVIDIMAESTIPEISDNLMSLWGIVELIDGKKTCTFTGYAFSDHDLDNKTKLFIAGVSNMKKHLETIINMVSEINSSKSSWDV